MEDDAFLEGAVLWLAEIILATLGMNKLDAWIREAGLADDIETLKSEIDEVKATVSYVKGRAIGNWRLARSLAALKQKLYDADDAVDELDYYSLRHQVVEVEGGQHPLPSLFNAHNRFASNSVNQSCTAATTTTAVTLQEPEGMHEAAEATRIDHGKSMSDDNILLRSGHGKKRSKAWDDFVDIKDGNGKTVQAECRHCKKRVQYKGSQGPRVLTTHVNSTYCKNMREARPQLPSHSSIGAAAENATPAAVDNSSSRARMGTNQEPTQITAAVAHPWNEDQFSSRIQEIIRQLHDIRENVTKDLNMVGSPLRNNTSVASLGHHQSTASDPRRRTSSLLQGKVYGRDKEKNFIINLMTASKSHSVTVVPIVGIGGNGKTALAQFVYNDPNVQNQFDHSIWVWVSNSFDEMRITREMLDLVPREKHERLCSLDKLQLVLKTHIESKRVLLILDDVWDDMIDGRLDLILAPFKSDNANGNVILVTTRYLSVAKRIGTTEPVALGALGDAYFLLLLKARAFRDENYEDNVKLTKIGREIAGKLKGNALAAVSAGELLRVDLTVGHWNKILKDEDGKLLGRSGRIMAALKLSYDQLPYHLHQCFSYCSIFPDSYRYLGEELVHIWISQGFVTRTHSSKRLEEIGMDYLAELVNLGYFQQVEREDSTVGSQNYYVVPGLMHDFARMVSRAECGIVDGLHCSDILPTVQHLSIQWKKDQHGNLPMSSKFKEGLRNTITSMRKLRTLVLIGQYDCSFFQSFEDIFQKAGVIRMLQISATFADFNSLMCSSVNPTHLRYLKLTVNEVPGDLPQVLSNFFHLQVLDVGSNTHLNVPHGMNNLVNLRHLGAASIARIGTLTSLQTLNDFSIQDSNGFHIIELQSMNDLAQLWISQLQNVKTREEACGAGLIYKRHLEKLHLSWNMSDDEDDSDDSDECEDVTSFEPSTSMETECLSKEVLEGLEPHINLKHLRISGYNGATSPSWLTPNISVTSLQTLHLEGCGEWGILPSLEELPFLAKLSLSNMPKVKEVSIPSLEELVLIKMPKLERCSCIFLRELNSCLRVLMIKNCPALKVFDLFGNGHKFRIEQKSWLPRLCELIIHNCPLLLVAHPLPSSSVVYENSMQRNSKCPSIEASSCGSLTIGREPYKDYSDDEYVSDSDVDHFDKCFDELSALDGEILAFHNQRFLTQLIISGCQNLMSISFKGLIQLESLEIINCPQFSGFDIPSEHTHEDLTAANCNSLPSLKYLEIASCGIAWECLSLILQHASALTELCLCDCQKLESLQLYSCTALKYLAVVDCEFLRTIVVLQLHYLSRMLVVKAPKLESLRLHSCTALEELEIKRCTSLSTLEGFQSLGSLRHLNLWECRGLHSCLEGLPVMDYKLCPRLEVLQISDFSFLATSFCKQLASLQRLVLWGSKEETEAAGLTEEQERGLLLLGSLTELQFMSYQHLKDLPAGLLHRLRSLQVLQISSCPSISGLPDLPPSLEELRIVSCSEELKRQSKSRASSKLKVKINGQYVN